MGLHEEGSSYFTVTIPSIEVESNITYYIEASDGKNSNKTEEYKIIVSEPDLDYNKIPHLLVTEVYQTQRMLAVEMDMNLSKSITIPINPSFR